MRFVFVSEQTATCATYHTFIDFYNWDEKCLQRGTDWVFKQTSLWSVFTRFKTVFVSSSKHAPPRCYGTEVNALQAQGHCFRSIKNT